MDAATTAIAWGIVGKFGIALQSIGLLLETVADYQKSAFKSTPGNQNNWCHVGLYRYFTHPNYLGELLFWVGTYMGGVGCFQKWWHWALSAFGMAFILEALRRATVSLGSKHQRRYSYDAEFLEFRRTHSFFGPFASPGKKVEVQYSPPLAM